MFIVYSFFSEELEICMAYRQGGVGTAIAHAIAWSRLSGSTLTEVRCLGQRLSEEQARAIFHDWQDYPQGGRCIWKNGVVLDHTSDKR